MSGWTKADRAQHRKMLHKLTNENCRRGVAAVAGDYARWAVAHGITAIHVFPAKGSPLAAANITQDSLNQVARFDLIECNPTDWGMKS